MSKKKHRKAVRTVFAPGTPARPAARRSANIISSTVPGTGVKAQMSMEELAQRHEYVKSDLKIIALISVPLILMPIIASFFVNI